MSISHEWFDGPRLVIVTLRDELNGQDLLEAYSRLCMDDRYYRGYHQLWDCRNISSCKVSPQDVDALKMMVGLYCPPDYKAAERRVAILVPQYSIFTATNGLLATMGIESSQRKVFRTFPAMKGWLGAVLNPGAAPGQ